MKLAVIGIDGADPEYIEKGIKQGRLPTIKKLKESGCYGLLKSTIPPLSLPAWPCIYTGKNPGKTGIYNITKFKKNSYENELVDWKIPGMIWQILSKDGKKVAVINNYFTYPPDKVNGVMVSAIDNIEDGCYYPKELEKEVEKKLGKLDFGLIPPYYAIPKKQLADLTEKMLESSVKLIKYIIKNHEIDFLLTNLDIDRLHHLIVDEDELIRWYSKIDGFVAEIIKELGGTDLILLSDHGGGKIKGEFYINEFLLKNGFLKLKEKYRKKGNKFFVKLGLSMENILKLIQVTRIDRLLLKILPHKAWDIAKEIVPRKEVPFHEVEIDWKKTKVFCPYSGTGMMYLNLEGRQPEGIIKKEDYNLEREEIISSLKEFCREKGIKIDILKREELFSGPFKDESPDFFFILDDWQYFPKTSLSGQLFKEPRDPGYHRNHGFLLAHGKEFKKGEIKKATVYDISPTILYYFGMPIDKDVDGRVLEIFKNKIKKIKEAKKNGAEEETGKKEIKDKIKELVKLGKI